MMITRVTSGVTNVNRLFTKVNKNWKFKKFDYIIIFNLASAESIEVLI